MGARRRRRTVGYRDHGEHYHPAPLWQIIAALTVVVACTVFLIAVR